MELELLHTGDHIFIEEGMEVYAQVPMMFTCASRPFCKELTYTNIIVGEVLTRQEQSIDYLIDCTKQFFDATSFPIQGLNFNLFFKNFDIDFSEKVYDTKVLIGEYVVTSAHKKNDSDIVLHFKDTVLLWPDGWHVSCHKVSDPSISIDFYQTGSFAHNMTDIKPLE